MPSLERLRTHTKESCASPAQQDRRRSLHALRAVAATTFKSTGQQLCLQTAQADHAAHNLQLGLQASLRTAGLTKALLDTALGDIFKPCRSILLPGRVPVGVKEGVPIEASHRGQEEGRSSWLLGWLDWLVAFLQGTAQVLLG